MKTLKIITQFLAKIIYKAAVWADKKTGNYERYSYETAPYCGHHFSGHNGWFTNEKYHEGDGGGETLRILYLFRVHIHTYEGYYFSFVPREMWYQFKQAHKPRITSVTAEDWTLIIFWEIEDDMGFKTPRVVMIAPRNLFRKGRKFILKVKG